MGLGWGGGGGGVGVGWGGGGGGGGVVGGWEGGGTGVSIRRLMKIKNIKKYSQKREKHHNQGKPCMGASE